MWRAGLSRGLLICTRTMSIDIVWCFFTFWGMFHYSASSILLSIERSTRSILRSTTSDASTSKHNYDKTIIKYFFWYICVKKDIFVAPTTDRAATTFCLSSTTERGPFSEKVAPRTPRTEMVFSFVQFWIPFQCRNRLVFNVWSLCILLKVS